MPPFNQVVLTLRLPTFSQVFPITIFILYIRYRNSYNLYHAEYFYVLHSPNFYSVNLQFSSCNPVYSIRVENSVDPDQIMKTQKPNSKSSWLPFDVRVKKFHSEWQKTKLAFEICFFFLIVA